MDLTYCELDEVTSTNTYAAESSAFLPPGLHVISARLQTAGRGQRGRFWLSPAGSIAATFCVPSKPNPSLSLVLALSLCGVLQKKGLQPSIKWPNDIKLGQLKLAGILAECTSTHMLIGIGINVNVAASFLEGIDQPATSLSVATGREHDPKLLLRELGASFRDHLYLYERYGFAFFQAGFTSLCQDIGKQIVDKDKGSLGLALGTAEDGALLVRDVEGHVKRLYTLIR